jgi:nucleoside-diphosphate-sugar epimerase
MPAWLCLGFLEILFGRQLINAGHQLLGLARNDAPADALARLGVEAHKDDLSDTGSLAAGARASDGVIHTALNHDLRKHSRRSCMKRAGCLEGGEVVALL